eukprot:CAMPEP_0117032420 /NCGR_PEP_ID=MMETSP0472-20121206/23240_1 /TAXON_ID=693140 ORGANISM="Tiarina fusus, Strain LIS" /NCGR_SAMPLE_ID=MMETSP0472 /ASSEMBLY_ACC=CAM_ASM_000603 /LENGTH=40 /DNA_ID= /DNA_START= /DNA_END= /DNA_ORIENTATION=
MTEGVSDDPLLSIMTEGVSEEPILLTTEEDEAAQQSAPKT